MLGRHGMQTEPSFSFLIQRPHLVIRIMIPLPNRFKSFTREIITSVVWSLWCLYHIIRFEPGTRRASQVFLQSEVRPAVNPSDRRQAHRSSHGIEVLHRNTPPFSVRSLHDATLMNGSTSQVQTIRLVVLKIETIFRQRPTDSHVTYAPSCSITIRFSLADYASFIRSPDTLASGTLHAPHR